MTLILVTGTRYWPGVVPRDSTPDDLESSLARVRESRREGVAYLVAHIQAAFYAYESVKTDDKLIVGDAKGIDAAAAQAAQQLGLAVDLHRADWTQFGRAAGPTRNQQMVDLKPDVCLAFPHVSQRSAGTKDCIRRARSAGVPVIIYPVPPTATLS